MDSKSSMNSLIACIIPDLQGKNSGSLASKAASPLELWAEGKGCWWRSRAIKLYIPESKYWELRCVAALGVQLAEATEKERESWWGCRLVSRLPSDLGEEVANLWIFGLVDESAEEVDCFYCDYALVLAYLSALQSQNEGFNGG